MHSPSGDDRNEFVYLSNFCCAVAYEKQSWQYVNLILVVGFLEIRLWFGALYMVRMSNRMQDGQMHEVVRYMTGSSQRGRCCS